MTHFIHLTLRPYSVLSRFFRLPGTPAPPAQAIRCHHRGGSRNFLRGGGRPGIFERGGRGCPRERRKRKASSQSVYVQKKVFCRYKGGGRFVCAPPPKKKNPPLHHRNLKYTKIPGCLQMPAPYIYTYCTLNPPPPPTNLATPHEGGIHINIRQTFF